jgi:hypothetical protein
MIETAFDVIAIPLAVRLVRPSRRLCARPPSGEAWLHEIKHDAATLS